MFVLIFLPTFLLVVFGAYLTSIVMYDKRIRKNC